MHGCGCPSPATKNAALHRSRFPFSEHLQNSSTNTCPPHPLQLAVGAILIQLNTHLGRWVFSAAVVISKKDALVTDRPCQVDRPSDLSEFPRYRARTRNPQTKDIGWAKRHILILTRVSVHSTSTGVERWAGTGGSGYLGTVRNTPQQVRRSLGLTRITMSLDCSPDEIMCGRMRPLFVLCQVAMKDYSTMVAYL